MKELQSSATDLLRLEDKDPSWEAVNDSLNKVQEIPDYDLENPKILAQQIVAEFHHVSEGGKKEALEFLEQELEKVDFSSSESYEKVRDFIYEMF